MKPANARIVTINGGSSSIKFSVYQVGAPLEEGLHGQVNRIGVPATTLSFSDATGKQQGTLSVAVSDHRSAAHLLIDWLAREAEDVRAAEAVALFCYQTRKWIGAFAAALGGLETLVFAGGIAENAAPIRARICEGLGFLGVELDDARNASRTSLISADRSATTMRVIRTDEEPMIARSVCRVLGIGGAMKEKES
jgi:acetate kinase